MKKLLFVGIGSALMFTMGGVGPASADNGVHNSTATNVAKTGVQLTAAGAGRCAGCHRTHTAKAAMLLKEAQPALCYTCHGDATGANTNVKNGTSGGVNALRGGGFEYALIGADAASKDMALPTSGTRMVTSNQMVPKGAAEATTSRHEIDGVTSGTMWGNGAISQGVNPGKAAVTLECGSCHDPHGNGNYRILKPVPNGAGTLVSTEISAAVPEVPEDTTTTAIEFKAAVPALMSAGPTGVNIPDALAYGYTTTNYWSVVDRNVPLSKGGTAVAPGVADGYIANVSQWCSTCHTRYLASSGAAGGADYETDSTDAVFSYRHTSGKTDKAGVSRPNCIQCHVSHGSNAAMSAESVGLNPGDTPARAGTAAGVAPVVGADSKLLRVDQRGTCVMCHNV